MEKVLQAQPNKYLEKNKQTNKKSLETIPEKQNTWLTVKAAGP